MERDGRGNKDIKLIRTDKRHCVFVAKGLKG